MEWGGEDPPGLVQHAVGVVQLGGAVGNGVLDVDDAFRRLFLHQWRRVVVLFNLSILDLNLRLQFLARK